MSLTFRTAANPFSTESLCFTNLKETKQNRTEYPPFCLNHRLSGLKGLEIYCDAKEVESFLYSLFPSAS